MKRQNVLVLLIVVGLACGCTYVNKQSYEIGHSNSRSPEVLMNEIETFFSELGFKLTRRTHITYPRDQRFSEFYIQTRKGPLLYSAFDHVVLRLENGEKLYVDWIRISDFKGKPPAGYFDTFYQKLADVIQSRIGVTVDFRIVEPGKNP